MSTDRPGVVDLEAASLLLSALSSSTKLAILFELSGRPTTVGDLCLSLDLSQSLVSHHLSTLRSLDLVHSVRRKQAQVYSLGPAVRIERCATAARLEVLGEDGAVRVAVSIASRAAPANGTIHISGTSARSPSASV